MKKSISMNIQPFAKQSIGWKYLLDNKTKFVTYGGAGGGGKLTSLDTPILTPFGFRKNRDLKTGDAITNPDGSVSKIIQIHPTKWLDKYLVYFHDGTQTNCGLEHLWKAWKNSKGKKIKNKRTFGEDSAEITDTKGLIDWMERGYTPLIPVCEELPFNRSIRGHKVDIDPYLLGVLLGDGSLSEKGLSITSMDKEIQERLDWLKIDYDSLSREGNKASQHYFRNDSLDNYRNKLRHHNLMGKKSHDKFIPNCYKFASIEDRYNLVAGLLDTDGTVDSRGQIYYTSVSEKLADDLAFVLRSLGAVVTIYPKENNYYKNKEGNKVFCRKSYNLYIKHRHPDKLFKIQRKKERTEIGQDDLMHKKIIKIEKAGKDFMRCISVSHPNGLYMQHDFIVTHNTWLGSEWLIALAVKYPGVRLFVGRNELTELMRSVYITFKKVFKWHNIPSECYNFNSKWHFFEFWNESRIDFLDVKYQPSDTMYERLGSTEYTAGWLEEVGLVKAMVDDVLKSRIGRHMNKEYGIFSKLFRTCNPKKNWVYQQAFKPWVEANKIKKTDTWIDESGDQNAFIQSFYKDNPHLPEEYGRNLNSIKDAVLKARLRDGNWNYADDLGTLIEYDKILDMFTTEPILTPNMQQHITCDVARFGRDRAVIMLWLGFHIRKIWYYNKSSTRFLREKMESICKQYHVPYYYSVVDDDGVGSGVVDYMPGIIRFINGSPAVKEIDERTQETKKYSYLNLRSQCYYKMARAINKGLVTIDLNGIIIPEEDKATVTPYDVKNWIIEELGVIKRKDPENNERKLQIVSKEDMKADLAGRSPDFSDTIMERWIFELGHIAVGEVGIV